MRSLGMPCWRSCLGASMKALATPAAAAAVQELMQWGSMRVLWWMASHARPCRCGVKIELF